MSPSGPRAWRQVCFWVLDGTRLEVKQMGRGSWGVRDRADAGSLLAEASLPGPAKAEAERLAATGKFESRG